MTMSQEFFRSRTSLSRRTALGGVGAAATALGLGHLHRVAAQDATPDAMAAHPIVGAWMVTTPAGPSLAVFFADGINIQGLPATQAGPQGVTFVGPQVGVWEPIDEHSIHFTGVQWHSDASGTLLGTITIDGYPTVSEDGRTLLDDNPESGPTIRDAVGTILDVLRGGPPVTGVRMSVGSPGFSLGTPVTGTPTT
jgi:hypothetical protein